MVIGNAAYRSVSALRNPGSDAAAIADALRQVGFQVVRFVYGSLPGEEFFFVATNNNYVAGGLSGKLSAARCVSGEMGETT